MIEQLKQKRALIIFVIYLRYLLGGTIIFSSVVKIKGERFTTIDGTAAPLNSAFHLFETLYQSGIYWQFLGWSQLLAGGLLMTQLFTALGTLTMFPIVLNIFLITISYTFEGTPFISSLLLLANIFLLIWESRKFSPLFQINSRVQKKYTVQTLHLEADRWWVVLGCLLFIITVVYVLIFGRLLFYWLIICMLTGLGGLVLYKSKS